MRLWPFALTYAAYSWNILPNEVHGLMPLQIFTGAKMDGKALRADEVRECPVYVLSPKLQDWKILPKQKPRARRGQ